MKPPQEKFIVYNEQQWREIKRVLARVGVDADTVKVKGRPPRYELQPLRDELQWQRLQYEEQAGQKIPTTRQYQQVIDKAVAAIVSFRDIFGPRTLETFYAGDRLSAEAREVLDRLEAELRRAVVTEGSDYPEIIQVGQELRLDEGGGPHKNAYKEARGRYWSRLDKIWTAIVPPTTKRPRLFEFVHACTGMSTSAIRSYFDRKCTPRKIAQTSL